jgi:hypothetical protein
VSHYIYCPKCGHDTVDSDTFKCSCDCGCKYDPDSELAALRAEVERLKAEKRDLLGECEYLSVVCANAVACTNRGQDSHAWLCKAIKTIGRVFERYGYTVKDSQHKEPRP